MGLDNYVERLVCKAVLLFLYYKRPLPPKKDMLLFLVSVFDRDEEITSVICHSLFVIWIVAS